MHKKLLYPLVKKTTLKVHFRNRYTQKYTQAGTKKCTSLCVVWVYFSYFGDKMSPKLAPSVRETNFPTQLDGFPIDVSDGFHWRPNVKLIKNDFQYVFSTGFENALKFIKSFSELTENFLMCWRNRDSHFESQFFICQHGKLLAEA